MDISRFSAGIWDGEIGDALQELEFTDTLTL
jgi:hypothetical protein